MGAENLELDWEEGQEEQTSFSKRARGPAEQRLRGPGKQARRGCSVGIRAMDSAMAGVQGRKGSPVTLQERRGIDTGRVV